VVPAVPRLAATVQAAVASWPIPARVVIEPDDKDAAFRTARAAIAKSGTSTLELALAGIPMVAAYKVPLLEELMARLLIRVPSIILANLVLGENVVPELLQRSATPERLAAALLPLLSDTPERNRQIEAFSRLDNIMEIGKTSPSDRAAAVVLDCAGNLNQPKRETVASEPLKA
jgi:lipid-A-disaccharide synthase